MESSPTHQFKQAITAAGLSPPDHIEAGILYRFPGAGKGPGNRAGWCKLFDDGRGGVYGDWSTGLSETWQTARDKPLTEEERAEFKRQAAAARRQAQAEREASQHQAAELAQALWLQGGPADPQHPYLRDKRIDAAYLRQSGKALLVPMQSIDGTVINLQRIYPDGSKRFLPGAPVRGAFWLRAESLPAAGVLYLAEGVATAATIGAALGVPVAAAMNCGNLAPVAQAIRQSRPGLELVIAADDDHRLPVNVGRQAAIEAAKAGIGKIVYPPTCRLGWCRCSDFADTAACAFAGLREDVSHA